MDKDFILKEIYRQNKHWDSPSDFFYDIRTIEYHRTLFYSILPAVSRRRIISIVGLRRVGKTVLLKQLMTELLRSTPARNLLFLSFDEALLPRTVTLADYLDSFLTIHGRLKERAYIFLDEIQYADKWHHVLKRYVDTEPRITFVVSGSSSLFLQKKTTESLAGRIEEFLLPVLSFEEYLSLKRVSTVVVDAYQHAAIRIDSGDMHSKGTSEAVAQYGAELQGHFEEYLRYGQFPELLEREGTEAKRTYLERAIFKKAVEYDIPRIFGVEKIDELKFLFTVLLSEAGSLVQPTNLAREIGVDEKTIKNYLSYFEQSFFAHPLYNYSASFRKSRRLLRKIYFGSSNFLSLFTDWGNPELAARRMGFAVENYVYTLVSRVFRYCAFYRVRKDEFDFLCSNDLRGTAAFRHVEVKWRDRIDSRDLKFLIRTAKKHGRRPLVISRSHVLSTEDYEAIPAWLLR